MSTRNLIEFLSTREVKWPLRLEGDELAELENLWLQFFLEHAATMQTHSYSEILGYIARFNLSSPERKELAFRIIGIIEDQILLRNTGTPEPHMGSLPLGRDWGSFGKRILRRDFDAIVTTYIKLHFYNRRHLTDVTKRSFQEFLQIDLRLETPFRRSEETLAALMAEYEEAHPLPEVEGESLLRILHIRNSRQDVVTARAKLGFTREYEREHARHNLRVECAELELRRAEERLAELTGEPAE